MEIKITPEAEIAICIIAIMLVCIGVRWVVRTYLFNYSYELGEKGYLIINPERKPVYFTDLISLNCYLRACKREGIVWNIFKVEKGELTAMHLIDNKIIEI